MSKLFLISGILIIIALGITLVIWFWLQNFMGTEKKIPTSPVGIVKALIFKEEAEKPKPKEELKNKEIENNSSSSEPYSLKNLPINEEQRQAAESMGIDVDAIEVTASMIDCAQGKLAPARIEEILGGDAPTFMETISLAGCLKQ